MYTLMKDDSLASLTEAPGAVFSANFSGRHDETVGWKEKLGYFELMRVHRQGHMEYWDNRDHGGIQFPGGMAPNLDLRYLYRFRSNLSWPAFSNCSADNVVGDGTAASGDSLGTINGYMEWDPALSDTTNGWGVTLSTRGLATLWGPLPAPDSLTVDVTPRRLQLFHPASGAHIDWTAKRLADGAIVQTGSVNVDALGLVTIPQVKVYHSGTRLTLGAPTTGLGVPGAGTARLAFAAFTNPVRGRARFEVDWPANGRAVVDLYDVRGRRVRTLLDESVATGARRVDADLSGVAPGVYFVRAAFGGQSVVRRCVLLR